jgi:hypothetical protein
LWDGQWAVIVNSDAPAPNPAPPGFPIDIKVAAFIPISVGTQLEWRNGVPPAWVETVGWCPEPAAIYSPYWFSTNDRERAGEGGGSKVSSEGQINTSQIGHFEQITGDIFTTDSHGSSRVKVTYPYSPSDSHVADTTTLQIGDVEPWSDEEKWDDSADASSVRIEAAAGYAFIPYAPKINYDYTFTFTLAADGNVGVFVYGWHDAFPAHEIIINGEVIYEYYPSDPGPSTWNLGGWNTRTVGVGTSIDPP